MKEAKIITNVSIIILIFLLLFLFFFNIKDNLIVNLILSVITGLIVSIITSLCQYFIAKENIKNNVFNCYFDLYKTIYVSEQQKILFSYNCISIYKKMEIMSNKLAKYTSSYSGFISNKRNKLYKKLNPLCYPNYKKVNIKNMIKLLLPFNSKIFKDTIIPYKNFIEKILIDIDKKKFIKEMEEFERIYKRMYYGK